MKNIKNFTQHHPEFFKAAKLSLPTFYAYFPLGMVFGIIFVHLHFLWYLAPIMSTFVFGGTVQLVALSMMVKHSTIYAIIFATIFVALRNSFYGLSLLERYDVSWLLKSFLIFTLVDATYAVLVTNPPDNKLNDKKFCFYLSLLIYLYWVIGSFVGAISAGCLPNFSSLSFILPCFFMILVIENFLVHRSFLPLIMPILTSIVAYLIMPKNYIILAIIISIIFILIAHKSIEKKP